MGASHLRVIFIHIFPNTLPILFSAILVGINNAVLAEAGLSYLGLGVQPPDPSLGRMLSEAKTYLLSAPWYEIFPCLVMIFFILGLTIVSDNFGVSGVSLNAVKRKIARLRAGAFMSNNDAGENIVKDNLEITIGKKKITYFYCPYVSVDTPLHPNTRMEIKKIIWTPLKDIKQEIMAKNPDYLYITSTIYEYY